MRCLVEIVGGDDFFPPRDDVLGVLVEADPQIGTGDVVEVLKAMLLQGHDGVGHLSKSLPGSGQGSAGPWVRALPVFQ